MLCEEPSQKRHTFRQKTLYYAGRALFQIETYILSRELVFCELSPLKEPNISSKGLCILWEEPSQKKNRFCEKHLYCVGRAQSKE